MDSTERLLVLHILFIGFMVWTCNASGATVTLFTTTTVHSMTTTFTKQSLNTTAIHHTTSVQPTKHQNTTIHPTQHHNTTVHPTKHQNTTIHPTQHHNTTVHPTKHHNTTIHPTKHHNTTIHSTQHHNMTVHPTQHHNMTVHPTKHHNMTAVPTGNTTAITHSIRPTASSHVVPTSTAAVPTVTPLPTFERFNVTNKKGEVCLLAYLEVMFNVSFMDNSTKEVHVSLSLPPDAVVQGECATGKTAPSISLAWPKGKPYVNQFTLQFSKSKTVMNSDQMWMISVLSLKIHTEGNPKFVNYNGTSINVTANEVNKLSAKVGDAYECLQPIDVPLAGAKGKAIVKFERLKIQPYDVPHNGSFSHAEVCSTPPPSTNPPHSPSPTKKSGESSVIPIAVGCSLAGLVVLVVIGYIIGRRHRRGPKYSKL